MTDVVTKLEVWGFQTPNNLQLAPFGYTSLSGVAPKVKNLKIGSTDPTAIYYGSTPVNKVYYGSILVWELG